MDRFKYFIKRFIISLLKCFPGYTYQWNLPKGFKKLEQLKGNYELLYQQDSAKVQLKLPVALTEIHKVFEQQRDSRPFRTTVIRVKNWRIWGSQGAIVTSENYLYTDASREFDDTIHSIFNQHKLVKAVPQSRVTTILAASGANVYYHWMFDILPRIDLLSKSVDINDIENFVINYEGNDFQKETLKQAGVDLNRILPSINHWKFHLKVDDLIVPSLVSANNSPSLTACQYLRQLFLPEQLQTDAPVNIYIKRLTGRKIINEHTLIEYLHQMSFQVVVLEQMSVKEQANLFAHAKIVVGAHGSGFTNIVFCQPGAIIVDLFAEDWINPCYWKIASHLQLKYGYLISALRPTGYSHKTKKNTDILVNINELSLLLDKLRAV